MNLEEALQNTQDTKPRYIVRNAAHALESLPPIDYKVDKLISAGSVNLIYGEGGSKKTYSLLSLAVCVATGLPWLGFRTFPCKVLIIDEESGETRLHRRLGEALRGEECGPDTPISYVCLAGFKIDDKNDITILQSLIEAEGAQLVIIDALADVMDGDENSKQDTQPVFNALRKIADQTNAAIIIIHHANKAGGYRGSSAIKGAVDLMVLVESENGKNTIGFKGEKSRDGETQEWGAVATWIEDKFYLRPYEREQKRAFSRSEQYVIRFLEANGASTIQDIEGGADTCSSKAANLAVYSLANKKVIYRTNPGERGRGVTAIYDLASTKEDGNDAI